MTISGFFYQLLISPLELLLEAIYGISLRFFQNHGLSIVLMSLVMNVLLLPLYKRADAIQAEEREIEKRLEPWVKRIKQAFRGEERFMMLQTYYNQNHYKPYYTLRGMLPLALEIPFFIAAYHFLSNLGALYGSAFGPISNLGAPDGLITVGGVRINALPVLMTLINFASSAIYTRGYPLKDKLTLYAMAAVFLVLLYPSPSGLVLYWTLNNLFSLVKNLFYRFKNPKKVLRLLTSGAGALVLIYALFFYRPDEAHLKTAVIAAGLLLQLPSAAGLLAGRTLPLTVPDRTDYRQYLLSGLFLALLTGVLIPSAVISASPMEFVQLDDYYSPFVHILYSATCAAGAFIIWLGIFYYLQSGKGKRLFETALWAFSGAAVVNYMFFGTGFGKLDANLKYEGDGMIEGGNVLLSVSFTERLSNLLVIALVIGLCVLLYRKKAELAKGATCILILAAAALSVINFVQIHRMAPDMQALADVSEEAETARFPLSRNGKNVVVIMLDRAIGAYVPYLFQEKPELKQQFAGFTYYPNTVSFGCSTNAGAPALFGGYEYTPEELNQRSDEFLILKHNEALKVMPSLFDKAGYEITVCDPVYAGYTWIPNLWFYHPEPDWHVYNTEYGQFSIIPTEELTARQNAVWRRSFFCYSIMKISPLILQPTIYRDGNYLLDMSSQYRAADISHAKGIDKSFLDSYSVLCSLSDMTEITDSGNTYLALTNQTPHKPRLLSEPDYVPAETVDNAAYDEENASRFVVDGRSMRMETLAQMSHYHVNMASLMKVGEWLDYLRENGVYDNTRIIIAADHGFDLYQFDNLTFCSFDAAMAFNPLLMVKDFGAESFSTDDSFMTNADVPTLAVRDLIEDPVNPFTGRPLDSGAKDAGELHLLSTDWDTEVNNGYTFLPGDWYSVHDSIFDPNNWKALGTW